MFKISCFSDEISDSFDEQIKVMKQNNIQFMCLRNEFDKNVLDLTDAELDTIATALKENSIGVSSIGSPIGKSDITAPAEEVYAQTAHAIEIAKKLDAKFIRIFSFFMEDDALDTYRDEVITRLKRMTEMAKKEGITLLCENEAGIYAQKSERMLDVLQAVNSPYFKTAFDPSNYVVAMEQPLTESYPLVKDYISYFHIKDSRYCTDAKRKDIGDIVICGEGDGKIPELLTAEKGKDLFLTLEPHLDYAGTMRGFSGIELFEKDYLALASLLKENNLAYI